MKYKLGKGAARHAVSFKFTDYFDAKHLPRPPAVFGHYKDIADFHMLANDIAGNCYWAGGAHEHMIWSSAGGRARTRFTAFDVLSDYSAATGFVRNKIDANGENPTDNGTDMKDGASYRRKTGMLDAMSKRHKIDGYLALDVGNWDQLVAATYLFGAAGVGLNLPKQAEDWFDAKKPWAIPWNPFWKPKIVGGHYVSSVGRIANGMMPVVTWGGVIPMSKGFYERFSDEALCYFSLEILDAKGLSPEGYDSDELHKHLKALK